MSIWKDIERAVKDVKRNIQPEALDIWKLIERLGKSALKQLLIKLCTIKKIRLMLAEILAYYGGK